MRWVISRLFSRLMKSVLQIKKIYQIKTNFQTTQKKFFLKTPQT